VSPSVSVLTGDEENDPDYQEGKTDRPQNADEHRHHLDSLNPLYPPMARSMQRAPPAFSLSAEPSGWGYSRRLALIPASVVDASARSFIAAATTSV